MTADESIQQRLDRWLEFDQNRPLQRATLDAIYKVAAWETSNQPMYRVVEREIATKIDWLLADARGLWLAEDLAHEGLNWKPCWELGPLVDRSATPCLPFPFNVRHLAAFLADGIGAFLRDAFMDVRTRLACPEQLDRFPSDDNQARRAVERALELLKHAEDVAGFQRPDLERRRDIACLDAERAWNAARKRHGIMTADGAIDASCGNEAYARALEAAHHDTRQHDRRLKRLNRLCSLFHQRRRQRVVVGLIGVLPGLTTEDRWLQPILKHWRRMATDPQRFGLDGELVRLQLERTQQCIEQRDIEFISWHDAQLGAARWMRHADIRAQEAAMLLCAHDPITVNWDDAAKLEGDEVGPREIAILRRAFEDFAGPEAPPRSLIDWYLVALDEGLRFHSWFRNYLDARSNRQRPVDEADLFMSLEQVERETANLAASPIQGVVDPVRLQERLRRLEAHRAVLIRRKQFLRGDAPKEVAIPVQSGDGRGPPTPKPDQAAETPNMGETVISVGHQQGVLDSMLTPSAEPQLDSVVRPVGIAGERRDLLTPAIEKAQGMCQYRFDTPAVFAALCDLAEKRYAPLIGRTESGIKWMDASDAMQELTLAALRDRLRRARQREGARDGSVHAIARDNAR